MTDDLLIYGSYGYTGDLIAKRAVANGMEPTIAGRSSAKLGAQAADLLLDHRTFDLDDPDEVADHVGEFETVLHCAGPFVHTYEPMVEACIETGTNYLDITGEIEVFEAIQGYDERAQDADVMLMPGAGFDVVPTDCLANHLHERLPAADGLTMAFTGLESMSQGTAKTMVEGLTEDTVVRRDGRIVPADEDELTREIDLGDGPQFSMLISWGDVSTAYHSTGIPNIEVYAAADETQFKMMETLGDLDWLVGSAPVQSLLKRLVEATATGPSRRERKEKTTHLWARVRDGDETASARLRTSEPYEHTVLAALEIATRTLDGDAPAGYRTPACAYGPDLVLECDDAAEREDIDEEETLDAEAAA